MATSKPTGLKITRSSNKFKASWKIPSGGYTTQQAQHKIDGNSWVSDSVTSKNTNKTFSVNKDSWFPKKPSKKLKQVQFRVQGVKGSASGYTTAKYTLKAPPTPKLTYSQTGENTSKFEWSVSTKNDHQWFTYFEAQSISRSGNSIVSLNDSKKKSDSWWTNTNKNPDGFNTINYTGSKATTTKSITFTEDSSYIYKGASYCRYFRVRASGPAGNSKWKYGFINYADPNKPAIKEKYSEQNNNQDWSESEFVSAFKAEKLSPKITIDTANTSYTVQALVTTSKNTKHPMKYLDVNYYIGTPVWNSTDEKLEPESESWTLGQTVAVSDSSSGVIFTTNGICAANQCLFLQPVAKYGDYGETEGDIYCIDPEDTKSYLSVPTISSIVPSEDADTVTIVAYLGDSSPSGSFIVYRYLSDTYPDGLDIGYSTTSGETKVLTLPSDDSKDNYGIGVYSAIGPTPTFGYVYNSTTDTEVDTSKTYYELTDDEDDLYSEVEYEGDEDPSEEGWYERGENRLIVSPVIASSVVTQTQSGKLPVAPTGVTVEQDNDSDSGTVKVTWSWSWEEADYCEISYSEYSNAWQSADEPSAYTVSRAKLSYWYFHLTTGQKWYFKLRFISGTGDSVTYGPYTKLLDIDLSAAPTVPSMDANPEVIAEDGETTLSWVYSTKDGTAQAGVNLCEVIEDESGDEPEYEPIEQSGNITSEQSLTLNAKDMGWSEGEEHTFAIKVFSESGQWSEDWSNSVTVSIAEKPKCSLHILTEDESVDSSKLYFELEDEDVENEDGTTENQYTLVTPDGTEDPSEEGWYEVTASLARVATTSTEDSTTITDYVAALTEMPMTVSVEGFNEDDGATGTLTLAIERTVTYPMDRPDESKIVGYEGETIAILSEIDTPEDEYEFELSDLIGRLDDGANYRLVATVTDQYNQTASDYIDFEVHWDHQAVQPEATAVIDDDNEVAILTPIAVSGMITTGDNPDVCDIYRLSADRPELIIEGATFGTVYVDPYPTIGVYGGYRFVTRTANGDYIDENDRPAWLDVTDDTLECHYNIVDFDNQKLYLLYEADISNQWSKDFQETKYLGGSVQGDWNLAVSRTASVSVTALSDYDQDLIKGMRRLAAYPGICHIRTKDGSSYAADIQVSETYEYTKGPRFNKYSLTITRVDSENLDGLAYSDWEDMNEEESE